MAKLFLIGNHRPSFAIARALAGNGHEVWAGCNGYSDYFELSRHVSGRLPIPEFENEPACIDAIEDYLKSHGFDALWPVTDRATRLVADHRQRLERHAIIVSPSPELIRTATSKTKMAEISAANDVPVAPHIPVSNRQQVEMACRCLGYPLVIKPTGEGEFIHGHKVITLNCEADLDALFPSWPSAHAHLLVQKRLNGLRHNHYFVAWEGKLVTAASVEVLRTDRADGSGYAVEGISADPRPDLQAQTERLVEALNYTGLGCAQYMTSDEGDDTTFLEINPRAGANIAGAEASGADLVNLAFELACGDNLAVVNRPWMLARPGVRYAWTKGDFSGLVWRLRRGASMRDGLKDLVRLLRAAFQADRHLVFDWTDPLPAVCCWLHPLISRMRGPADRAATMNSKAKAR